MLPDLLSTHNQDSCNIISRVTNIRMIGNIMNDTSNSTSFFGEVSRFSSLFLLVRQLEKEDFQLYVTLKHKFKIQYVPVVSQ